jgi:protein-tyrosine kinase
MLIPKASHLVERVAERLLRSGALEESSAQLLRQPSVEPAADAVPALPTQRPAAPPAQRSSLFAPPPVRPASVAPIRSASFDEMESPDGDDPIPGTPPLAAPTLATPALATPALATPTLATPTLATPALATPAIHVQPRMPGQAAVLDRPEEFGASPPPLGLRPGLADPAAGMLQGPVSVDAVSLERAGMVDWSRTRTRISEEFRLVQRQIIRSAFGPGAEPGFSNLLLVTSARPGEGKSFMSTNLSGSIARQGDHHVLLVDADSKRDSICYSLGLSQARGLLDLAANPKLDPAPLIVKTPIERLSILPVGRERERSAELFSTKEMTRLIQSLGRRYADRLLILDAPPCLSTSDPAVLAQVVGQILFVVEADRTQRDEIEASLDLIQACPTITMVLNKQQISSRYTFGAYSSYYSS